MSQLPLDPCSGDQKIISSPSTDLAPRDDLLKAGPTLSSTKRDHDDGATASRFQPTNNNLEIGMLKPRAASETAQRARRSYH